MCDCSALLYSRVISIPLYTRGLMPRDLVKLKCDAIYRQVKSCLVSTASTVVLIEKSFLIEIKTI